MSAQQTLASGERFAIGYVQGDNTLGLALIDKWLASSKHDLAVVKAHSLFGGTEVFQLVADE